jgi:hypothetical protein
MTITFIRYRYNNSLKLNNFRDTQDNKFQLKAVASPVMTIVKKETEQTRGLSFDEKIQKVEDLTLLIDRGKTLNESRWIAIALQQF